MRATLCVATLVVCLIALQCTANCDSDPDSLIPHPPPLDAASPPLGDSGGSGGPGSLDSDNGGKKVVAGSDGGSDTDKSRTDTNQDDRSADPNIRTGSSVSATGSSSQEGITGVQSVPDSSTDTTTTTIPTTADDNNKEVPQDNDQLLSTDGTLNQPPPSAYQQPQIQASDSFSQTEHSARTAQESPQPASPPTPIKEKDTIQGNTDNIMQQNGQITTTVKSEPAPQPQQNVNPRSDPADHSSNKGGQTTNAAAEPIANAIAPAPPLPGHANTPSNPAKPPVSSSPLQTNGNTDTGQNTGTNIAAPQTNTSPTVPKVNTSAYPPTPTNTINAAAANTMKPSTNSATVPGQDQATLNFEEKKPHQSQTLMTTTSIAAPTASKETSVTVTTESAKVESNAPAPPLPKLSTSLQSLENKDSSIKSVSLFSLTILVTLFMMVALPAS